MYQTKAQAETALNAYVDMLPTAYVIYSGSEPDHDYLAVRRIKSRKVVRFPYAKAETASAL